MADYDSGIETNSPVESGIEAEHDLYYYVDDEKHAFVVGATVMNEVADQEGVEIPDGQMLIHVDRYVCEGGLVDKIGATNSHTIAEGTLDQWLAEYIDELGSHEEALELARTHWDQSGGDSYDDHRDAVRALARAVVEIAAVDVPELDMSEDMVVEEPNGADWIEAEQDADWWDAWVAIERTVRELDGATTHDSEILVERDPHRRYLAARTSGETVDLSVRCYQTGDVRILAEYLPHADASSMTVLYEERPSNTPVDPIDLGREVASAELAWLAHESGSAAAALDHWQTERSEGWYSQSQWAAVRGVGRQTVHDRVQDAQAALDNDV